MKNGTIVFGGLALFLSFTVGQTSAQNVDSETGVQGMSIGSKENNTYSAFVINGANHPLDSLGRRDILFRFDQAGTSGIRAYRGSEWDTYLQFLTTPNGSGSEKPKVRMHIDGFGRVGIGTTDPWSQLDVNGTIRTKGVKLNGDLQFGDYIPIENWGHRLCFSNLDDNTDPVFISRYNTAVDASELRVSIGDCVDGRDKFTIGLTRLEDFNYTPMFSVLGDGGVIIPEGGKLNVGYSAANAYANVNDLSVNGNVGIGTLDTQGYKLAVNGTIRAKEIKVESNWADFVFKKGYKLPTLGEVEQHIKDNGTLPGVPSEKEIKTNGINVGEANALLLQKIEELTLYAIKQQKLIEKMQVEINRLKK